MKNDARLSKTSVTLTDGVGNRRDVLLGRFGTAASKAEYIRVIAEWEASGRRLTSRRLSDVTVNEVIVTYWDHVEAYYRLADGTPTSEVDNIRLALKPLKTLYGQKPANAFDALALETVREHTIREGHCRNRINKDVARIKGLFKWAASKKLVPSSIYHDLTCLEGLRAGRSKAKETAPVQPVSRSIVEQTLAVMRPTLADLVRLQLETGMRPGEVCIMRGIDIDMTNTVWLYRPCRHKTEHQGYSRIVPIGPRAQEIIRRHLKRDVQAYLFSLRTASPNSVMNSGKTARARFSHRSKIGGSERPNAGRAIASASQPMRML